MNISRIGEKKNMLSIKKGRIEEVNKKRTLFLK
jgi:hypothetical protein